MSVTNMRQIVRKKLGWFKPKNNIRKHFDEAELRRLGASLKTGQVYPLLAEPDGSIGDGERRWRAAQLVGLEELDVIIVEAPVSESERRRLQAKTVFHKADLTPGEKYELVYELVQLNNWQEKEVAEYLDIHVSTVSKLLSFSKIIPAGRQALKEGLISINEGHALSQLPEATQAELLPKRMAGEISNREEMLAEVKARKKSNGTPVGRFNGSLPSGVQISVIGSITCVSDLKEVGKELAKLADKMASKEGVEDLKVFAGMLKAKNK